jgi:pSer/pThr/pTyr-binding forkhead associated (FHA) protein
VFIQDFNSKNGTFVNGERVQGERQLRDGDHLKIAGIEFRIALNVEDVPEGSTVLLPPDAKKPEGAQPK